MKSLFFSIAILFFIAFTYHGFAQTGGNSGTSRDVKPAVKPVNPFQKSDKVETEKRPNVFDDVLNKEVVLEKRKPKPKKNANQEKEQSVASEEDDYDPFSETDSNTSSFSSGFGGFQQTGPRPPSWGRNSNPFDSFVAGVIASMFVK